MQDHPVRKPHPAALPLWLRIGIPAAVIAADRIAKELSVSLPSGGRVLIPGVLGLRYTENRGMAFSLFSGHPQLLGILSLLVIAGAWLALRRRRIGAFPAAGLLLMLGGALGNLPDRLFRGFVPDMIELLFVRFAIFNLADAALTAGCAVVILSLLFRSGDW